MNAMPKAQIKQSLADLIPRFMANRRDDVAQLRRCLDSEDRVAFKAVGHRLKGAGTGYGFPEISALGASMDAAALTAERARLGQLVDDLESYLDTVVIEYR